MKKISVSNQIFKKSMLSTLLLLTSSPFFFVNPGYANSFSSQRQTLVLQVADSSHQNLISKSDAISKVKSEVNGKILSADLIESKGPPVYKIKVLLDKGRVRSVYVDGLSGKIIRIN